MDDINGKMKNKIAKIKHYKKIKKIQSYRRKVQINVVAAKFMTYASIPALGLMPFTSAGIAEAHYSTTEIIMGNDSKSDYLQKMLIKNFDVESAIKTVVDYDNEKFINVLNRQFEEITEKAPQKRRQYTKSLFGGGNYCNMAVVRAMKLANADYLNDFIDNIKNPALCDDFVKYVKKTHPDCINFKKKITKDDVKKGDIIVMKVLRNKDAYVSETGNHTVTYEGDKIISFNSEGKYDLKGEGGFVIDLPQIREKELQSKVANMAKDEAVLYLMSMTNHHLLAEQKTKVLTPEQFAYMQKKHEDNRAS